MPKVITVALVALLGSLLQPVYASVSTNEIGWNKHSSTLYSVSKHTDVKMMDLVVMASIESTMGKNNYNRKSGASGLFGFTNSTWRAMIKRYGKTYGIRPGTSRNNPRANALLAAAYMKENQDFLEHSLHRRVGIDEIYMAHLLGPGGAVNILKAKNNRLAKSVVPGAGRNASYFYRKGRPLTVAQFKMNMHSVIASHQQAYRREMTLFAFKNQLPMNIADVR